MFSSASFLDLSKTESFKCIAADSWKASCPVLEDLANKVYDDAVSFAGRAKFGLNGFAGGAEEKERDIHALKEVLPSRVRANNFKFNCSVRIDVEVIEDFVAEIKVNSGDITYAAIK